MDPGHDPDPAPPSARPPASAPRSGRNLPVAIGVGVVLAALFVGSLYLSHWAFLTFVAVLVVGALLELDGSFRSLGLRPATPVAIGAGLVMFYGTYATGASAQSLGLVLLLAGTITWTLLDGVVGRQDRPPTPRAVTGNVGATVLAALWVPFLASFLGLLLTRPQGEWFLMATIALAVTNDIGAYAFGSRFGKRKLAASVSPSKTWEGFAGGLGTVVVLAALGTSRAPGFDGDVIAAVTLGVAVVLASTFGDLTESLVKRDLGIKDMGRILPGHGGIMDRVDAILFALPAAHVALLLLGR